MRADCCLSCVRCTTDSCSCTAEVEKLLPDMDILITTPFHPCYMTRERFEKAKKLELVLTAGIGSDHIDLHAAADKGITVAEVRICITLLLSGHGQDPG